MNYASCVEILDDVLSKGAYLNLALSKFDGDDKPFVTRVVMGVVEKQALLDKLILDNVEKKPQQKVMIVLKVATFCLCFNDSAKPYAIINEAVGYLKSIGKGGTASFCNAVLRKVSQKMDKSAFNEADALILPDYLVNRYKLSFGEELTNKILNFKNFALEHISINPLKTTKEEIEKLFIENNVKFEKSAVDNCYFVKQCGLVKNLFAYGKITFISLCSVLVCQNVEGDNVLDVCSAPGGKAIQIAQKVKKVVALDVHLHRVKLLQAYKNKMGATNIEEMQADARELNPNFVNKFDAVLVDAPCTGFGIVNKKPDILLNRKECDIATLQTLQKEILQNVKHYVKKGGCLVYSTCTTIDEENGLQIKEFLKENKDFVLEDVLIKGDISNFGEQYLPIKNGYEGFFISKVRRI